MRHELWRGSKGARSSNLYLQLDKSACSTDNCNSFMIDKVMSLTSVSCGICLAASRMLSLRLRSLVTVTQSEFSCQDSVNASKCNWCSCITCFTSSILLTEWIFNVPNLILCSNLVMSCDTRSYDLWLMHCSQRSITIWCGRWCDD